MAPMSTSEPTQTDMAAGLAPASGLGREDSWQHLNYGGSPAGSSVSGSYQNGDDEIDYDAQGDIEYQPSQLEDATNEALLHPLRDAANRVGREVEKFAEVLDSYNPLKGTTAQAKKDMAFDLIEEYHDISIRAVNRLRKEQRTRRGAGKRKEIQHFGSDPDAMDEDDSDMEMASERINTKITPEDLERWEKEARTWDLLHRMTTLQYSAPDPQPTNHIHRYSPEAEIWESFLHNDPVGLERCTVLQWLKDTANESGEDIHELVQELQQNAERGDITAHGWLHTKEAIKKQKRLHAWPYILDHTSPDVQRIHLNQTKTEPLISQLDPDAPGRQDRKLEAPDEYFERSIWLGCYELLRRGKSGREIKDWCQERQEVWRAVSMSGLPDVLMHSESGADFKSKALWRRMCHALTKREGVDTYEAAVYGILSGDYYSIEPVCKNWDDFLFMHYNAQLRSQYEKYVLENFPGRVPMDALQAFEAFDAISFYGEAETVATRTVAMVNRVRKVEPELRQPLKHIQGVLIAKEFRHFILGQGQALADETNANSDETSVLLKSPTTPHFEKSKASIPYVKHDDFDGLRVLTHMLLAFKSFGMDMGKGDELHTIENVIVAYISLLKLSGKEELIPLYACQLSEDRCYATLSHVLLGVTDSRQRETQIKLMQELGLDVQRFVKLQIQSLFEDYPDTETGYPAKGFRILDPIPSPIDQLIKTVEPDFMATEQSEADTKMILAFQWYLFVDGMWAETFRTGVALYKRFFKHKKLGAARDLSMAMSANAICETKTGVMMGKTYKLEQLLSESDLDVAGELGEEEKREVRYMSRYMAGEAKLYQDLESLIVAIGWLEDVAGGLYELQRAQAEGRIAESKNLRLEFAHNYPHIRSCADALLNDWLNESVISGDTSLTTLRTTYLPPVLLAYSWLLHAAGLYIGRENLLDAMDLATKIAADSSLVDLFLQDGDNGESRMKELVEMVASNCITQVCGVSGGKRGGRVGKVGAERGWRWDVWMV